jgi:hypothetical protein
MSEGSIGVLILLVTVVISSIFLHRCVVGYWIANFIAALAGTVVLHAAAYVGLGYSDPFDVISIPFAFLVGIAISAFVGNAVRSLKRSRQRRTVGSAEDSTEGS